MAKTILKIKESDLLGYVEKRKRQLKENRYISEMTKSISEEGSQLSSLSDKVSKIYGIVDSLKDKDGGTIDPATAERVCALCNSCADNSLDVFGEISISDIDEISAVRALMSQISNILYDIGIMVRNYDDSQRSFSQNKMNGGEFENERSVSGKIGALEKKLEDLSKFVQKIESSFKGINREISIKRHSLKNG